MRLVTRIFASWNQLERWLRGVDSLRRRRMITPTAYHLFTTRPTSRTLTPSGKSACGTSSTPERNRRR
jgi:hypothetical protein